MRAILVLGALVALSACGGGGETESDAVNTAATDNMMLEDNMAMDPAMNMDANAALGGNAAVDAATANAMATDLNTNDADTNLANGM